MPLDDTFTVNDQLCDGQTAMHSNGAGVSADNDTVVLGWGGGGWVVKEIV